MASRKLGCVPYLCVLPALLGCLLFTVYPVIYVIYLSLHRVDLLSGTSEFVSVQNYARLFYSEDFLQVLGNTVIYMVVTVSLTCSVSLVLAVMLNRPGRFFGSIQTAVFSPHIIPLVAVSMLWQWLMDRDAGLLNLVLGWAGFPKLLWIDSPETSLLSIIIVSVWKGLGFNILVLIAGLQAIPGQTLEAARLDNAGPLTLLAKIIIPQLSPTLFFLVTINIINSFQVFDSVKVMTGGGPGNSSNVLVHWIYQSGFEFYRFGDASAGAVILFVIVSILTLLNFGMMKSRVHYQ